MKKFYKIGEISKLYNISSDILRYYEKIGLITPDMRGENGYRYYSQKQIWKLNNIRNLRNLGVSLDMITNFLNDRSMEKTKTVINFQLTKINEQLKKLLSLKEELEEKKKNIEYFENFSQFETPIIKEIEDRYVLYKEGNFKEEEEIDFELKKLKRLNFEDNDFIFTSRSGSPITQQYVAKELQKRSEKLIPPENPHKITGGVFRNTFLYRKCELEGVSLSVVANAMGTNAETCLENIEELVELRKQYIN